MAKDFHVHSWTKSIDKWIEQAGSDLESVVKKFIVNVETDLVDRSPVDTGRFKANWQVTANEIPMHALNEYDKTGQQTINSARRFASMVYNSGVAVRSIHFSNMLIYANALEYGHSKQAPAGVLGIVSIRLSSHMAKAIRDVRSGVK